MNTDVEELLRAGMRRLAGGSQVPSGLVTRARRYHHRRLAARSAVLTAAVAVAAVAVFVGGRAGPATGVTHVQTTAWVMGRVEHALVGATAVVATETTFSHPFPAIRQWSYRQNTRVVQEGDMTGTGLPWAQGHEDFVSGTATVGGKRTYVRLDVGARAWEQAGPFLVVPNGCQTLDLADFNSVDWATYARQTLSCGVFTVAGRTRLDSRPVIKVTGSMTLPNWWGPHADGRGALHVAATLYVSPVSYFPVRVTWVNWSRSATGATVLRDSLRQDITLLPATARNVAQTSVTIPAGFRELTDTPLGGPVVPYFA